MGIFLLGIVALAMVLLLSTRAPASNEARTPAPGSTSAAVAQPTAEPLPTPGPTPLPTQPPLTVNVSVLEPNYTVEAGDTLGAIAQRFSTTVEALIAYNRLEDAALLRPGQKLLVPQE